MATKAPIDPLTGLRGIAAMMVIFNHYFVWSSPYAVNSVPGWLALFFGTSDYGMALFFTLSGFVITYNYFDFGWDRTPVRSLLRFVYLRWSRLYPALAIFIFALAVARISLPPPTKDLAWTALHLLSVETWLPLKLNGALPIDSTFHVSWSISTEFLLYFMFAALALAGFQLVRVSRLAGKLAIAAIITIYVLGIFWLILSPTVFDAFTARLGVALQNLTAAEWRRWFFYLSPYFRILEFGMGCCAALLVMYRKEILVRYCRQLRFTAAAAVLGLLAIHVKDYWPGSVAGPLNSIAARIFNPNIALWRGPILDLLSAALFSIIMANGTDSSRINKVLAAAPLIFLGEISYSLYLFHPLSPRFGIFRPNTTFSWSLAPVHLMNFLIFWFFAVVFAFGMYKLVEMPAQRVLRLLIRRRQNA